MAWAIFSQKMSSVWTTCAIRSNGLLGYPFEKKLSSVRTAMAIRSKTKLSTVRATEAIFSKITVSQVSIPKQFRRYFASNDLLFSSGHDTLRSLFTNALWILCHGSLLFAFICIDIRFIQYLRVFFNKFPENNIFYLLRFCSLWASGTKLSYSLHVKNTNTKKIPFNWLHSFFTWLFLYHKEVTKSLFQHVTLCVTIFLQMKSATCNFTGNSNICRTNFDTHTLSSRDEVLISLVTLLQVLLSS